MTKKADEIEFARAMLDWMGRLPYGRQYRDQPGRHPRAWIEAHPDAINYKRAWYLLLKWSGCGWYDYGVCLDLGWFTPEGIVAMGDLIGEPMDDAQRQFVLDPATRW